MMMKKILFSAVVILFITGCTPGAKKADQKDAGKKSETTDPLMTKAKGIFGTLPAVAASNDNVSTKEKVLLGKTLYFDNRLSKDNVQSCNTCHNLDTWGVDNLPTSPGNNGEPGTRNSPTVLNAALHTTQFWDGREETIEDQAGGPILNPAEMAIPNEDFLIKRLSSIDEYKTLFAQAYPDETNPITYPNIQNAIGVFERELMTPSKFDDYLAGNASALNEKEKAGLESFINTGCITCHIGNVLGGNMFQKFGLYGDYWEHTKSKVIDNGRFDVTQKESDKYIFKVPTLRNVDKTWPYFHDGSVKDLKEAVVIMAKLELDKNLTDTEADKIVEFLGTLTGEVPANMKE
jgi:cytochrome c peroxidase